MFRSFLFVLLLGLASGCARQKFAYPPLAPAVAPLSGPTLALAPLADGRTNRSLDRVMESGYLAEVEAALLAELRSTGLFREVAAVTNLPAADWRLEPSLKRLNWFVADYDAKNATAFISGLLGGVVGGTIYLSLKDNALGFAEVELKFVETSNGAVVTERRYQGTYEERLTNAKIDSAETQARLARVAFQKAMEQMKQDLPTFMAPRSVTSTAETGAP